MTVILLQISRHYMLTALGWVIALEGLIFLLAICSLVMLNWRDVKWDQARKELYLDEMHKLIRYVRGHKITNAVGILETYPTPVVREFVLEDLPKYDSFDDSIIRTLYSQLGFKERDREQLNTYEWTQQIPVLRRWFGVIEPEDKEFLAHHVKTSEKYPVKILGLQLLTKIDAEKQIVAILKQIQIPNRLMEEPLDNMMDQMDELQLSMLLVEWEAFRSVRVKRLVLQHAARKSLSGTLDYVELAVYSDNMELRIGACRAAIFLPYHRAVNLVTYLLENDTAWEVRAQATVALGRIAIYRALDPLTSAIKDRSFWVRQNAARALRELGPLGIQELKRVVTRSDDAFARDTAQQELDIVKRLESS